MVTISSKFILLGTAKTYGSEYISVLANDKFEAAIESSATTAIFNCLAYNKSIASAGATSRTFINRLPDNRALSDRIYRYRYVIPAGADAQSARPPRDGYILQKSNDVTGLNDTEVALPYNPGSVTMSNQFQMRNFSFLRDANWDNGTTYYTTELPHDLEIGSKVVIDNITSQIIWLV